MPTYDKHLPDKDALEAAIISTGFDEQAARFEAALEQPDPLVALARAAWAFGHGMTILELNNRFPPDADLDAAWEHGIAAFRPDTTTKKRRKHPR